jgi:flagellar basal-body rod modification protein FlgD
MSTVSNVAPTQTQQSSSSQASDSAPGIGKEFESFIRLLTAQIRNQDPLSPLDSTQFVEQLATFSTLEQQVRSNVNLESIAKMIYDMGTLVAGQWLGKTVTFESSWIPYTGSEIRFTAEVPAGTDHSALTVRDANGNIIWTEKLTPGASSYSWDGRTTNGAPVPVDSVLQFRIDTYKDGQQTGSVAPRVITTVTSVGSEDGTMRVGTSSMLSTELGNVQLYGNP